MTRVCAVQIAPRLFDRELNTGTVVSELAAAASEGAELVVFPEAALTGYVFESHGEALDGAVEAGGGEVSAIVETLSGGGVHAIVGAIERDGTDLFNTAFVVGPAGLVGRYRKIHTLCLGADRFTRPGGERLRTFDLPFGRVGVHICYDGTFPETARALRLLGAQLLTLPTNWPRLGLKRELVRVRAYENHAFYVAVNRVGEERGVVFRGGSVAAAPDGSLLLEADDRAGRHHIDIDLALADETLEVVRPGEYELDLIRDRWPDLYRPIVEDRGDEGGRTGSRGC